ncbi:hypothetical protein EYR40_001505 [Pleurotus pulmonarius]|nr:hypothetical protein EYR38_004748 [Pleurotus pulmonarius]KAF4609152.1 hypothetical protein EYR40_001505 [Pleurotus pulmonarius]
MRWSSALSYTLTLALMVKSLPSGTNQEVFLVDDFDPSLPEAGEIVFEPLHFDADGFDISEDGDMDAAILADWKTEVVKQHNAYRAQYGAPALTWSDALYPGTQQWANQCKFQHSNGQGKYGENLAAGTGGSYGFSSGLKSWMDEASKYDYNHPGFSQGTGHFTQVVWKSSKQVACAIGNCRGGTIFQQPSKYLVCRYTPPGNFAGRYVENVGRRK